MFQRKTDFSRKEQAVQHVGAANPYAAPRLDENTETDSTEVTRVALERLRAPGQILLLLATLNFALDLMMMVSDLTISPNKTRLPHLDAPEHAVLALLHLAQMLGIRQMLRLRNYRYAYITVFSCCLPLVTPFLVLGMPFGLWTAGLLNDRQIVKAFLQR